MRETRPVLIVGAGPTGMTAAMELARFGVPVRLVDKYVTPPDTSRALAVQSRTMELMQQRGLAGDMLRLGNRGRSAALHANGKTLGKIAFDGIDSRFNFILLLPQSDTERTLRDHLQRAGVCIESKTELVAFSEIDGPPRGVRATLRKANGDAEDLEAAYVIDTEGAHSFVRHTLELPFEGASLPNTYAVVDLYLDGDVPEDELSIYFAETGLIAAFPMGNRRFRLIVTEKHEIAKDAKAPSLDEVRAAWSLGAGKPVTFRDLQWSSRFRINSRALKALRHDRIFFAGDSAHIHSPAGGQGMNTGIQDAINLGWKLAMVYRGAAPDALLDTYGEERLPIIHDLVYRTERATDLANSNSHFVHVLLRHLLPIALDLDVVRRQGATMVSELAANYRKSSLSGAAESAGVLHAGDRFPDIPIESGNANLQALDILDPSRFTVLSIAPDDDPRLQLPAACSEFCAFETIGAPSDALRSVLGRAKAAVIRPDGYLLYAGSTAFVSSELAKWLARWMPAAQRAMPGKVMSIQR